MNKIVIYLLVNPDTMQGYIVADTSNNRGRLAQYLIEYGAQFGSVLTPEDYPDACDVLRYISKVYDGYFWQTEVK